MARPNFILRRIGFCGMLAVGALSCFSSSALAQCPEGSVYTGCAPGWEVTAHSQPSELPPGGRGLIYLDVLNVGAAATEGPFTVTDTLPPGVTAIYAGAFRRQNPQQWDCTGTSLVRCTNDPANLPSFLGGGGGPDGFPIEPPPTPQIAIEVAIAPGAPRTLVNRVTVTGGGAPTSASSTSPLHIGSSPAGFGVANWDAWFSNQDGTLDTQAGSHPYAATFDMEVNTTFARETSGPLNTNDFASAGGELRNVAVDLPPGFVGNPTAVPRCPRDMFDEGPSDELHCPADTVVGTATSITGIQGFFVNQVYNLVPPPGVAAEFGFTFANNPVFLDSSPRTGGNNEIVTHANNVPQGRQALGAVITLWGVPGDPSHDAWRCIRFGCASGAGTAPFLTLPTACGAPQPFSVRISQWQDSSVEAEKTVVSHDSADSPVGLTGCERLGFGPTITTAVDTSEADSPTGLTVEVKPQVGGLSEATGLGTSDLQNTTVTLPEGLVINPGQAAGLQACPPSQNGVGTEDAPSCPLASKVGEDEIQTPLLPHALKGNVYVLQSDPPNLELLVAASGEGVNLKLVGKVHLDGATGRLTSTFAGTPELPFTNFKLSFSGGAQAALDTPAHCGTYSTSADFDPWSSPFISDFLTSASLSTTSGPDGGACPSSSLPFGPSLTAGSTTDQAGGFTSFSLLLQNGDGQQRVERLQFKAPAGLSGILASVPLCGEPLAGKGECAAGSQIGHATVASGPGPYPLVVPQPGKPESPIYLTGPYDGAPFGLSIVTHVLAGPFDLGTIVTRAKIDVDPVTAQITVTTDPLPQIVQGVPTDLRLVDAVIDRPGFMFNPTNCGPQSFSGTAWGTPPPGAGGPGVSAAISTRFQVGSCQSLKFAPKFAVATAGKTSKANGASLTVKLSYPAGSVGTQANITRVKVDLPKQLPSRLTTLQKACTNAQFEANPAGCPAASIIGHAIVHTPLLPVPLEGPAYFVSHGGEAFPSLIMVLQGYGVTVDLVGTTFISKAGITSSTFKTVPDVPFNTFELVLPQGKFSALAANGNLCASKLTMPTEFLGQNGSKINQSTPVVATGCAKKKPLTRAQKLTAALKTCKKNGKKARRAGCETRARKQYGPAVQRKTKTKKKR
ncbi:MAG TPA: hypothetical protein VGL68_05875 [Solirubrobacteraceae bacterium]|jgi:hypothetical protein